VQACETPTVGADGRAVTITGICTLTPIGGKAAARPTGGMIGKVGLGVGVGVGVVYAAM